MNKTATIRQATNTDLKFLRSLAKRHRNQIGYMPDAAIEDFITAGGITIGTENQEAAGYILARPFLAQAPHIRPIYQAAVCFDARRHSIASRLVDDLARAATRSGQTMLQAWCRTDLDANAFWKACGFIAIATRTADTARGHASILWRRPLVPTADVDLERLTAPKRAMAAGGKFRAATAAKAYAYKLLNFNTPTIPRQPRRPNTPTAAHVFQLATTAAAAA